MAHLAHTFSSTGKQISVFLLNDSLPTNYCFALSLFTRKQKESDEISSLLNNGKFIYLRHYLLDCTVTSFQKKSEISHRRVRNRSLHCSPCRKGVWNLSQKSETSQKKSETCLSCAILMTLLISAWQCCMIGDKFDPFGGNKMEGEERLSCIGR